MAQAIVAGAPRSGIYFVPTFPAGATGEQKKAAEAALQEKMARGPQVFAAVRIGPMGSLGPHLAVQFVSNLLTALLATLLLLHARPTSLGGRVLFVVGVALAGWAAKSLPYWNWYAFSAGFTLAEQALGFALAGLALARIVPKSH